jgi:thiol-disulfide isomerase/thioredoxin
MKKILLLACMLPTLLFAQQGMVFEHNTTWKAILAKAKKENKPIFMDAFTTWCGPCKYMSANIFPMPAVGEFFNSNYINVKVQLDTAKEDNEEIKKWYADAHMIMNDYKVNVFPTYLFIGPDGKLLHRSVGSSPAEAFIAKGKDALDPEKQYYTLLSKYTAGNREPEFLKKLAVVAEQAYDRENSKILSAAYLSTQNDLLTKDNLIFLDRFTSGSSDKGFELIMQNPVKFDEALGAGAADKKITDIAKQEDVYPKILMRNSPPADWTAISAVLNKKYPKQAAEILSSSKVVYFQRKGDWNGFQVAVQDYMKNYGSKVSPEELNNYAWTVFENCKDMTCVTEALDWSKRSFKDNNDPTFMDTYANILYKLGKKEEAIRWEEKALGLVSAAGEKKTYEETLAKMKKGEKTWKD